MRENAALRSAAKDLLARLKRQEAAVEQLEKEGATKGEEIRVLKRRIEAWLLHGFGSKSVRVCLSRQPSVLGLINLIHSQCANYYCV